MEEKALVPTTTQEVDFYGDLLTVALANETPYVAIKPITDFLGLDWASQRQRVQRDEVMKEESRLITTVGADGRQREMFSLPLEYLPGYLFGINASRVKPELKEKVIRYQRECFRILWQAFQSRAATPDVIPQLVADQAETRARVGNLEQDMKAVKVILSEIRGLSSAHRATAKEMVDQISKMSGTAHRYIWADLNKSFHVAAYGDIQDEKWAEVQKWLQQRLDTARQGKGIEQQTTLFDEDK
jgi:P22_AR N-terminal domain